MPTTTTQRISTFSSRATSAAPASNMEGRTKTIPLAIFVGFETNLDVALGLSVVLVLRWIDPAYAGSITG